MVGPILPDCGSAWIPDPGGVVEEIWHLGSWMKLEKLVRKVW